MFIGTITILGESIASFIITVLTVSLSSSHNNKDIFAYGASLSQWLVMRAKEMNFVL